MGLLTITKEFGFDYGHKLCNDKYDEETNKELYQKCNNVHGHRGQLFVTVSGTIRPSGFIINFTELKDVVNKHIIDKLDHRYLNDVEMFKGIVPSCENMIVIIWKILDEELKQKNIKLEELKLYETPTSYAIYKGEYY